VNRRRQPGFALMLAIFLIVTLAAVGMYLITTSTAQVAASAQDENAVRAYQAARSGLEVGAYQILRNATCTPNQTITFTAQELTGFIAQVTCTQLSETESGSTVTVYTLVSLGCNASPCTPSPALPASPTYVEREVQITITRTI
jgi:MSHA biogenesis protein MshP